MLEPASSTTSGRELAGRDQARIHLCAQDALQLVTLPPSISDPAHRILGKWGKGGFPHSLLSLLVGQGAKKGAGAGFASPTGALLHCGHGSLPNIWLPHPVVITKSLGPDKAGLRGLDRPGAGWRFPLASTDEAKLAWEFAQLHRSSGAARTMGCVVPSVDMWTAVGKAHHGPPISANVSRALLPRTHPDPDGEPLPDQDQPSNPEWHLI